MSDDKKKTENKKRRIIWQHEVVTLPSTAYVHLLLIKVLCIHVNLEKEKKLNLEEILM